MANHDCFGYAYLRTHDTWHFTSEAGETVAVRPSGRLRANNGEAALPAVIAGLGIAAMPEFIVRAEVADGRLEPILPQWSGSRGNLYLITPPNGPRPARVQVLADFLI